MTASREFCSPTWFMHKRWNNIMFRSSNYESYENTRNFLRALFTFYLPDTDF